MTKITLIDENSMRLLGSYFKPDNIIKSNA